MNIRTAVASDLPAIDKIYNEAIEEKFKTAHTEPMGKEARKEWFKKFNDKYPLYVYEKDRDVIGWLAVSPYRPGRSALSQTAEVSFYVSRSNREKGVGSALLKHAIMQAESLNFHVYFAILMDSNQASIFLLKKHGFEKWGAPS